MGTPMNRGGGCLVYGIPGFKLEKPIVARPHSKHLEDSGVAFKVQYANWPDDLASKNCVRRTTRFLIATGVIPAKDLKCPGRWLSEGSPRVASIF